MNTDSLRERISKPEANVEEIHQHQYFELLQENEKFVKEKLENDPEYFILFEISPLLFEIPFNQPAKNQKKLRKTDKKF